MINKLKPTPAKFPALPERLIGPVPLPWVISSLLVGSGLYLALILIVVRQDRLDEFFSSGEWWYYSLLPPALTTYLLLMHLLSRRLLHGTLESFRPLLPSATTYDRLVTDVRILKPYLEWLAFGLGAILGWLAVRPWERDLPEVVVYNFIATGVMFGLLAWTIYSSLATTRFLAHLQDQVRQLNILGATAIPSLARWGLATASFFLGGIAVVGLFIPFEDFFTPEVMIFNGIVLLVITLIFLRTGVSTEFTAQFRIFRAILLFAVALLFGTLGYHRLEGWPLMDGLYMTVITMTTIGYGEIGPMNQTGRIFTIFLALASVGIGGYAISTIAAFMMEGDFQRIFEGTRMDKQIADLKDHIILCGIGRVGMQIAAELYRSQASFVVVDQNHEELERLRRLGDVLYVRGDAARDETLRLAGIERAKGLIVALSDDKENSFVVLTGRSLNPNLRIVARLVEEQNAEKLRRVGADEVVSPNAIGGVRMASMMVRPAVIQFFDEVLNVSGHKLGLEEVQITARSALNGQTLREAAIGREVGLLVVAIRSHDGKYQFNPSAQTHLTSGDILIVIGTPEQLVLLRKINAGGT
ncbi:MAG: potassium channel protein [Anaerolineae bacterium]|nr:potassium channel protein [Anaerolineae bacterium]MCB0181463.1 potassium channel protein [Anaerolineae bacterium]MCB0226170.1 potassium channel protein [Anaerolineae bacterium]MCB9108835.1 potassium channel protein [Anaerolineales bacterium]